MWSCQYHVDYFIYNFFYEFELWAVQFATHDVDDIMATPVEHLRKDKEAVMDRLKNQEKEVLH